MIPIKTNNYNHMKKILCSFFRMFFVLTILFPGRLTASVEYDTKIPQLAFAEKIGHWQHVFQYSEDRGIEIYLFHWNVMTFGATGKHGITPDQTNPVTIDYMRKCIRQALLTYPNIKGIGVTAGENADNNIEGEYSIENFLSNTYGRAIIGRA
jgi:hypothetical protein